MSRRGKRWLSVLALGLLAFTQANGAVAGCLMDRGQVSQAHTGEGSHGICEAARHCRTYRSMPMSAEGCLIRCTTELQAFGRLAGAQIPIAVPVRYVRRKETPADEVARPIAPSRKSIPLHVLLHSFLI